MASPNKLALLTAMSDLKDLIVEKRNAGMPTVQWQTELRRLTRRLIDLEAKEAGIEPGDS